ncbi:hypothetical protein GCM10007874_40060 [Labrys miyagiensis]|uniref:PPC domain-containing protein n=1 Tax=Labrys miyagiensis TaxID=346912 RepID=A0ABQ6CMM0_9HYPH|nr:hypothetical protein GCM10007874_40060 [Labrys miyagiensis]
MDSLLGWPYKYTRRVRPTVSACLDAVADQCPVEKAQSAFYRRIDVAQQCEVLSAIGDIALEDYGQASLHLHVVLGLSDGSTGGGHFLDGKVRPTLEVIVSETPAHLRRRKKPELGIALIDIADQDGSQLSAIHR